MSGRIRVAAAVSIAVMFVAGSFALPAAAAAPRVAPSAIINGYAAGSGAYIPFNVNPNVQFYPAHTMSELDPSGSHGLAAGLYPGFLVDAAAQFYRYGQEARSMLGIAESQWPNPPQADDAATTEFGDKCRFMSMDLFLPEGFARSCRLYWGQYGGGFPLQLLGGRTTSEDLISSGWAQAHGMTLAAGVTIGSITSTSSTEIKGRSLVSSATVLMDDVRIADLHIERLQSVARAQTDGTRRGSRTMQRTTISRATVAGQEVVIDDEGLRTVDDSDAFRSVNAQLAERGFQVRLIQGVEAVRRFESSADAGGLSIQYTAASPPEFLADPLKTSCATAAAAEESIGDALEEQTGRREVARIQVPGGENPLLSDDPDSPLYYDARHVHLLPRTYDEVDQPIPPALPCLAALSERDINIGMTLGPATARARLEPVSPIVLPDLDDDIVVPDAPIERGPLIGPPPSGPADGPTQAPPAAAPPRRGLLRYHALGADVSKKVSMVYGILVMIPALLLAGRRAFGRVIRA
ncbi:MAG: hypothetical protein ACRDJM_06870 [Actinomycetota bacterium]